jgi:hypothetical protein
MAKGFGGIGVKIRNWDKFQHYKSGPQAEAPKWIKLYPRLLNDLEWSKLADKDARILMELWLLASERGGALPPIEEIAFRLRRPEKEIKSVLSRLPNWIETPSRGIIDELYTASIPEEEGEKEEEEEGEENKRGAAAPELESPLSILKTILNDETAEAVLEYRSRRKQSNSTLAINRLVSQLSQFQSPNEGAAEMICRGWSGFRPEWMESRGAGPPQKEAHFRNSVQQVIDEVDRGNIIELSRRAICGSDSINGPSQLHATAAGHEVDAAAAYPNAGRAAEADFKPDG